MPCTSARVPSATWLFWITKTTGTFCTAARFMPSWQAAVLVAPSPIQPIATRSSPRLRKARPIPATTVTLVPMWLIGWRTPALRSPMCRSRPALGESDVARYPRNMSASDMPIMCRAPALRIIGATMSRDGSSARTFPTVTASSPVPSHAFEMTPVRTHRFSPMSCSRVRRRSRYSERRSDSVSARTMAARSGSRSGVCANSATSCGSGAQLTYSGGSKAGYRFMGVRYEKSGGGEGSRWHEEPAPPGWANEIPYTLPRSHHRP